MKTRSTTEWLNDNEGRSYPLAESASLVDDDKQRLPMDIIADLGVMVPPSLADIRLSALTVGATFITIGFSSGGAGVLIGTFLLSNIESYKAYALTPVVGGVSGYIAFGNKKGFIPNTYRFADSSQSAVELRAMRVVDELPIEKIFKSGTSGDNFADNVVTLDGAGGLTFKEDENNPGVIIVSLDPSERDQFVSPCIEETSTEQCGAPPIRTINGIATSGIFTITLN